MMTKMLELSFPLRKNIINPVAKGDVDEKERL